MNRGGLLFSAGVALSLGFGWYAFPQLLYKRAAQPLQFNHEIHMGEKAGMSCQDCHSVRDDGTFSGIPVIEKCAPCHAQPLGTTEAEKILVEQYVTPGKEIMWHVYSRQPDNVFFPHAVHLNNAKLKCEDCHGDHGKTKALRSYEENRVSGYSRDIWGPSIGRVTSQKRPGMKMDDCVDCHNEKNVQAGCLACHK